MTRPLATRLLGAQIAISNALCDLAAWAGERGHPTADARIIAARHAFTTSTCRYVLGHPRVIYGAMRDICLDCLTIVDEHPNGRGR